MNLARFNSILFIALASVIIPTTTRAKDTDSASREKALLTCQIDYELVVHLGKTDDVGRVLVWEGNIKGDIIGTVKWWFGAKPNKGGTIVGGKIAYYSARWEIWNGDTLILAGDSAGKTVTLGDADGIWDGNGIVTETCKKFAALKGGHIYESGSVVKGTDPALSGSGIFTIKVK